MILCTGVMCYCPSYIEKKFDTAIWKLGKIILSDDFKTFSLEFLENYICYHDIEMKLFPYSGLQIRSLFFHHKMCVFDQTEIKFHSII